MKEKINEKEFHDSQRGWYAGALYNEMIDNPNIIVLTGDLGFGQYDRIKSDFPERFINCGAAEQCLLDIACGIALSGKIPVVYTISSFYLRAAEAISLYVSGEQIPVILIGGGRDDDYKRDGQSHMGYASQDFIKSLKIESHYPQKKEDVPKVLHDVLSSGKPSFISVRR